MDTPARPVSNIDSLKPPKTHVSGYDCEFVAPPPSLLEAECSICLQILREPHLISCCGHNFCRTCIDPVSKKNAPCPLCSEESFTVLHNKGLQRALNELEVTCAMLPQGCQWKGPLGKYVQHLNEDPRVEFQLEGCLYVELDCIHHCSGHYLRKDIQHHQDERCPQRPFCCNYCRDYNSIHADVVYRHWLVCKCYPLSCPNHCTVYAIERQHLDHHLATECPLKEIECDFSYAGCEVKVTREDMPAHLEECHVQHTSMLAAVNQRLSDDLSEKDIQIRRLSDEMQTQLAIARNETRREIEALQQENFTLKQSVHALSSEVSVLKQMLRSAISSLEDMQKQQQDEVNTNRELIKHNFTSLTRDIEHSDRSFHRKAYSIQASIGLYPIELTMEKYSDHKRSNSDWQSPPFLSHLQGYRLVLIVNANGSGSAKDTHVSVYITLTQGQYDDNLKWPFRGDITIQLLNQLGDRNHATSTIHFNDRTPAAQTSRVKGGENATRKGWGLLKFIEHVDLEFSSVKNRQYLKEDCLTFRITKIELMQ